MSNKPFTQAGRRTPLSLSGTVAKSNPNKSSNIAANSPGNNANGNTTSSANNKDSKMQQQKNDTQINNNPPDTKELSNKQQQPHTSVKQHQIDNRKSNEKNQNGVNNNKQQFAENKLQYQSKNANDEKKVNEKDRNEKSNKSEKASKSEKLDTKLKEDRKEDQKKSCNNKEEKKVKEVKCAKDDKNEEILQNDGKNELKNDSEENKRKIQENAEKVEEQTAVVNFAQQTLSTPETPKNSDKGNKSSTSINKTPIKSSEKTPQKLTPTNSEKAAAVTKRDITTTIDDNDIEMEPLAIESSPIKSLQTAEKATNVKLTPTATSTPSKIYFPKSEEQNRNDYSLERPREFSKITGRKGIHNSNSTLYKTQSYLQFCTSKDANISDSSMNVTVGSEVPDFSLSLFNRRRKRENSFSQKSFSANLQNKEITPPKKARLDGFLSALSSPLSLLSNRFSKASFKSSTLVGEEQDKKAEHDNQLEGEPAETSINANNTLNLAVEEVKDKLKADIANIEVEISKSEEYKCNEQISDQLGIKITDTQLQTAVGDPFTKNKRCIIM